MAEKTNTQDISGRLDYLDSIRGLAALAVLCGHIVGMFSWPNYATFWTLLPIVNIIVDGRSAVTMFFVLSGFVLARPYLLLEHPNASPKKLYLVPFYVRRFARIWIPWFFSFCLSLAFRKCFFYTFETDPSLSETTKNFWRASETGADLVKQCFFLLHDPGKLLLPQDWSLGIELKASILMPGFIFLARKGYLYIVVFALLMLVAIRTGTGPYYFSFVVGVLVAKCSQELQSWFRETPFSNKIWLLLFGVLCYEVRLFTGIYAKDPMNIEEVVWGITTLGCAMIIISALFSRRIQKSLRRKPIVFFGRISYSVYLLQFIVILCILPSVVAGLNSLGWTQPLLLLPSTLLIGILLTVAFASATYYLVEVPAARLGLIFASRTLTFDLRGEKVAQRKKNSV